MTYCRYCGTEISYKRSKNERWIPTNVLTGEPHFCRKDPNEVNRKTGIEHCKKCGRAYWLKKEGSKVRKIDYTTLDDHECKQRDITSYQKELLNKTKRVQAKRK